MKILILTQYFPPEIGAPQNRLFELACRLQTHNVEINVLTAMPNYPHMEIHEEYRGKTKTTEIMHGMEVHRRWIFVSKNSGIVIRLLNYFSFVFTSFFAGIFSIKKHDIVFCESPPLFLGISAYLICKLKGAKLIFNVSDLWPESAEKLGLVTNKTMLSLATILEEFLYQKSTLITGQTQGIVKDISTRFPHKEVYWLPNGVDLKLFSPDEIKSNFRNKYGFKETDILFFYAGIIGHAQGLDVILDAAKMLDNSKVKIVMLGEGPEKERLVLKKEKLGLDNIIFLNALAKSEMPDFVAGMDVAVIPLKKLDLFKGAIPSKIFENLAMKKPIILGVEGEAYDLFIKEGNSGLFYEPENADELAKAMNKFADNPKLILELGNNGRKYVSENFDRNLLANNFFNKLEETFYEKV